MQVSKLERLWGDSVVSAGGLPLDICALEHAVRSPDEFQQLLHRHR